MCIKNKNILFIIALFILCSVFSVQAQDISEKDISFDPVSTEGDLKIYKAVVPGIDNVILKTYSKPASYEKSVIMKFYNELNDIEGLVVKQASVIFTDSAFEAAIIPESFVYKGKDFNKYLPAGLTFIYKNYTQYDFRMLKDTYFMRIRGEYFSPEELFSRMEKALEDPVNYIVSHNPEYVVNQLGNLGLENSQQNSAIDKLKNELTALLDEHNKLKEEYDRLRYSFIAATKKGIYGSKTPVPQEQIDMVLDIKKANPRMSTEEVYNEMKVKGIKITKGKVALIINTYLGDY